MQNCSVIAKVAYTIDVNTNVIFKELELNTFQAHIKCSPGVRAGGFKSQKTFL